MQTIKSGIKSCRKANMRTIFASFALAVGLLIGASLTPATAAPNWPVPSGVKTVEVNGYPIAYIEAGAGVPVIILHGMFVDHRLFAPQVPSSRRPIARSQSVCATTILNPGMAKRARTR